MRRTILHLHVDSWRRTRKTKLVALNPDREAVAGHDVATIDAIALSGALRLLAPRQRVCVVLRYHYGLSSIEIADELAAQPAPCGGTSTTA